MTNYNIIILFLALSFSWCYAQKGEIIPLSPSVGTTVDVVERNILGLFPDIEGFESAQFYEVGINQYIGKIVTRKRGRIRVMKKKYSWAEFQSMKKIADQHPEITPKARQIYQYRKSIRYVESLLQNIPSKSYLVLHLHSGDIVRGFFRNYQNQMIQLQQIIRKQNVFIRDINMIEYRPFRGLGNLTFQSIYFSVAGLGGVGIGEVWNTHSNLNLDVEWYHRFGGMVVSLLIARKFMEYVVTLTSPKEKISIFH